MPDSPSFVLASKSRVRIIAAVWTTLLCGCGDSEPDVDGVANGPANTNVDGGAAQPGDAGSPDGQSGPVCDPSYARPLRNPTGTDLPLQEIVLQAAVPCNLGAPPEGAQYQVLSTKELVFQTDLPANTTKKISINDVLANHYPYKQALHYATDDNAQTVGNEYFTVVMRKTQTMGAPKAPIESIKAAAGNLTISGADPTGLTFTGYKLETLEQGPLIARFRMTYEVSTPEQTYGDSVVWPANPNGHHSEIVEIRAGVNGVFFEEENTSDWAARFELHNVNATRMLYRAHHANSIAYGYELLPDGTPKVYESCCGFTADAPLADALRDLVGGLGTGAPLDSTDYSGNPRISTWDPWAYNSGRFEVVFDADDPNTNWVGIMGGGASRTLGVFSGINYEGSGTSTSIVYTAAGRGPDARLSREAGGKVRYAWALTSGVGQPTSKTEFDKDGFLQNVATPAAGLLQDRQIYAPLTKTFAWTPDSDSETFSKSLLYLEQSQQDALFTRLKTDPDFVTEMCRKDGYGCNTFRYIANPTAEGSQSLYDAVIGLEKQMLEKYWHHNGYLDGALGYIRAGEAASNLVPLIPLIMADPNLTATQKADVYRAFVFFGSVLRDGDFAPLANYQSFNLGTANMPLDFNASSASVLIPLQNNAHIREVFPASTALTQVLDYEFSAAIDADGASISSPHYSGTFTPALNLCQQAQAANVYDCVAQRANLAGHARWKMGLVTPPEIRFGGERKTIALNGDGSTESRGEEGQLATIFAKSDPALSAQLMAAWDAQGGGMESFFQSAVFKIDQSLPRQAPFVLDDGDWPGYMTVLRSGFGTADESALWFLHGTTYQDHGRANGQTVFYLLGVPVSTSWSCMYTCTANGSPHGALLQSGVMLAKDIGDSGWDGADSTIPHPGGGYVSEAGDQSSASLNGDGPTASATYGSGFWRRSVALNRAQTSNPVVVIGDSYPGGNTDRKILSQNFMATGAVSTPAGNITPPVPSCDLSGDGTCRTLPTNEGTHALGAGWSQFQFTGQYGDVSWVLLVYTPDASAQFQLGAWINNWHNVNEYSQYQTANGAPYREMQYQFRLWTTAESKFVVVPYRGTAVPSITTNGATSITVNANTIALP